MSYKKIRDDNGYWRQLELYIRDHSEVECSHGLCPECAAKIYPDYARGVSANSLKKPPVELGTEEK